MDLTKTRGCRLQITINRGIFFDLQEVEILQQLKEAFSEELDRLKNAQAAERGPSPDLNAHDEEAWPTPSKILYGRDYDEVNRTLIGVLALKWIFNNNYERFTAGQSSKVKLSQTSFEWLRRFYSKHLKTPEDIFTLVLSMIVNDLGKDPNLEEDYCTLTKRTLQGCNHDTILFEAAKVGMISCLDMLDKTHREYVMLGLELGSELNASQLAQAENVPINLEGLLDMRGHEHAFNLKFMEQILDVAGAAGHYNVRGAKNFIEPVFQAFKTVYEVALDIIAGKSTLRQAYDKVLTKRGDMLSTKGFRRLSVSSGDERALLRLLTMGRTASLDQAELFSNAFEALDEDNRELLVTGLNIDGNPNETAVLPYYMPAMLSESLDNIKNLPKSDKIRALTSLMRYLARVLESSDMTPIQNHWVDSWQRQKQDGDSPFNNTQVPGLVIERNMMKARATISSDEFRTNPNLLDDLDIPTGQILQRRRTSHSL